MNNEFRNDDVINCGDISISMSSMQVYCDKVEIILTRNEFKVFFYLLKNYRKAITREELLNNIWGYDTAIESRASDDTVKRLRRKLNAVNSIVFIDTVWGYGFRIRVDKNLGQDDELKHELFIEFSKLGGNYKKIEQAESLKNKIDKYHHDIGTIDHQLLDLY